MKKWFLSLLVVPTLLVGCNAKIDTNEAGSPMPQPVEVTILTEEKLPVGEKVKLVAQVKQGEEIVEDAEEVKFEVWESGMREESVMLEGVLTKDGTYEGDFTFNHEGVYYMFAHTTARGMHVMPKVELIVGNPNMSKVLEDNSSNTMNHSEGNEHDDEDSDHNGH